MGCRFSQPLPQTFPRNLPGQLTPSFLAVPVFDAKQDCAFTPGI
jgi:hypothetical protein